MHKVSTITKEKISEKLRSQLGLSLSLCEEITLYVFAEILNLAKKDQNLYQVFSDEPLIFLIDILFYLDFQ